MGATPAIRRGSVLGQVQVNLPANAEPVGEHPKVCLPESVLHGHPDGTTLGQACEDPVCFFPVFHVHGDREIHADCERRAETRRVVAAHQDAGTDWQGGMHHPVLVLGGHPQVNRCIAEGLDYRDVRTKGIAVKLEGIPAIPIEGEVCV